MKTRRKIFIPLFCGLFLVLSAVFLISPPLLVPYLSPVLFSGVFFLFLTLLLLTRKPRIIFLTLASIAFCLLAIELVCIPLNSKYERFMVGRNQLEAGISPHYWAQDPKLGFSNPVSTTMNHYLKFKGKPVFDVEYVTDQKGRRICPSITDNGQSPGKYHALFFGCSFTFGYGVESGRTLPCAFQKISNGEYVSYNYGVNQYSTGLIYLQLGLKEIYDDVEPKKGVGVYVCIPQHMHRNVGNLLELTTHERLWGYFFFRTKGSELAGPYTHRDLLSTRFMVYLYGHLKKYSPALRYYLDDWYSLRLVSPDQAVETTVRLILGARDRYNRMFPQGRFVVLLWPPPNSHNDNLVARLKEHEVAFLAPDYPSKTLEELCLLPVYDQHPSTVYYELMARKLYSFVENSP